MRIRCYCETNPTYRFYGARGITICLEWQDFAVFREWAHQNGYRDDLSIDRIDSDGNYEPNNCRWVSKEFNSKYKRGTKTYTFDGVTATHGEWAERLGISASTLTQRINRNGLEKALSMEKQK